MRNDGNIYCNEQERKEENRLFAEYVISEGNINFI